MPCNEFIAALSGQTDNGGMLRFLAPVALVLLAGCSPTFNWREVRAEGVPLKAMLPCKPDKGSRPVPMGGRQVELQVLGCETGGATFAVLYGDIGDAARAGEVLAQWQAATLANMHATASRRQAWVPPGATALPQSAQVVASGERADHSKVEGHAGYFARGGLVVQAVIYADRLPAEAADAFFSGLKLE
jgi:hypothetical protein